MIAYEELEKALARWKARRSSSPEVQEEAEGPETAPVPTAVPSGEVHPAYQRPDNTGELDLTDAEVTDA